MVQIFIKFSFTKFIVFIFFSAAFRSKTFTSTDIGQMAALVDVDKMSHQDAAKAWLAAHEDVWKPFTE